MKTKHTQIVASITLLSLLALLPACWPFSKKALENNDQQLYVVNVLDKESFEDCRIAGSINVPFDEVESFAKDLNRSSEVVVYCSNYRCTASMTAAEKLKEMGFENVWAFEGGTAEWYQMNKKTGGQYPVEGSCQASYLNAANEKPTEEAHTVAVISAEELHEKMMASGMLTAQAFTQEAPQQAAA